MTDDDRDAAERQHLREQEQADRLAALETTVGGLGDAVGGLDARVGGLDAKLDAVLAALGRPPTPPAARAGGPAAGGVQMAGEWAEPTRPPPPGQAERVVLDTLGLLFAHVPGTRVEGKGWKWPEGESGPLVAQLVVAVDARTTAQPAAQRRLVGASPDPSAYTHAVLVDTGTPADGRRTDLYAVFVRVTVPLRGE